MQKDAKQEGQLSTEIQDVMKFLISAFRIVKIYPSNNPIYSQSLAKAFETLSHYLETAPEYRMGVQKTFFTFGQTPLGKDGQVNKSIAQDLFSKSIREIVFISEITEQELQELCTAFALSPEELAMKNGIATVLWEQGVTHIKVTEAGLDEVITTKTDGSWETDEETDQEGSKPDEPKQKASFAGKTLVLGDVKTDPEAFGEGMLEFALRTRAAHETVEERLYTLYQQAGRKIMKDHAAESDVLFQGLAKSILALEGPRRDAVIAGMLYGDLDTDIASISIDDQQYPNPVQEVSAGRYQDVWSIQQVVILLKKSSSKPISSGPPASPGDLKAEPLDAGTQQMVRSVAESTPEEMEALKVIAEAGMESDIIEAAVRTLTALFPLVKSPVRQDTPEKNIMFFSAVVHQLEDILTYLLKSNKYDVATVILKALRGPVEPEFKPRIAEALKKTATKPIVKATISDMRRHPKGSAEYTMAYDYLANLDQKATEALLDLLNEESDRNTRIFLLDLLKEFGKDQFTLLSEYIADGRWYVVRNIVSILAESKSDQAIALLRKAAEHKNFQIRQEVIKALIAIGGKKAASVLSKFLRDQDEAIQLLTIRSFPEIQGIGPEEIRPLMEFLEDLPLNKKTQEVTVAVIKTLGKLGGGETAVFLNRFTRVSWWKARKPQEERREAAGRSIEEITRRQGDGGRAKR